jgi:hypothetical protein
MEVQNQLTSALSPTELGRRRPAQIIQRPRGSWKATGGD